MLKPSLRGPWGPLSKPPEVSLKIFYGRKLICASFAIFNKYISRADEYSVDSNLYRNLYRNLFLFYRNSLLLLAECILSEIMTPLPLI